MKKGLLKIVGLLVISAMIAGFAGCSKKAGESGAEDGFTKIKDRGYVTLGFDNTFVPMGFKNEKGDIVGFDIDLAKEAFKRLGLTVKFQPIDWSMKETELNGGNIDMIWNGYTITKERKEKVAFTQPYLENKQIIITLVTSGINSKKDLKGRTVAAQSGSSSLDAINKEPALSKQFIGGGPILFETNNEALIDLEAGRTDAVVADEILGRYYIAERGESKYKVLLEDFGKEEYGIGLRKGDKTLLDKLEGALSEMKRDGTCGVISKKWFGENIVK